MPQRTNQLLIYELSNDQQQIINDYIINFYQIAGLSIKKWHEILRKSKDTIDLLNKIEEKDVILFIKEFPIDPLIKGVQISQLLYKVLIKDNDLNICNISFTTCIANFNNYYQQILQQKLSYLSDFLFYLFSKYARKGMQFLKHDQKMIENDLLKGYHQLFFENKNLKYCNISIEILDSVKVSDFQIFKFTIHSSAHETLQENMETYIENFKSLFMKKVEIGLEIINQKVKPKIFNELDNFFSELITEIKNTNIDFKNKMAKFLIIYQQSLEKHLNYFASNDSIKIYQKHLPKINFKFLWYKKITINFYFENKPFLDKYPDLWRQLLSLKYSFKKDDSHFKIFTKNILQTMKEMKNNGNEINEYQTFYRNLLNASILTNLPLTDVITDNQIMNNLETNYINNVMLTDFVNTFANSVTEKVNNKGLVATTIVDEISHNNCDETITTQTIVVHKKNKVKTKGKAGYYKNKTQKVKMKKQQKVAVKNTIIDNTKSEDNIKNETIDFTAQHNIEKIAISLQKIKNQENSAKVTTMINDIIKVLKKHSSITAEQNEKFLSNLQILNKIKKAENSDANSKIIKNIYSICLKNYNFNIDSKNLFQIFTLINNLKFKDYGPSSAITASYLQISKPLPPIIETDIIEPVKSVIAKQEATPMPVGIHFYWSNDNNLEPFMIYNLKETAKLDHEGGRPAIYWEFNEQLQKHVFICGTSSKQINYSEVLRLELKKETYFYLEDNYLRLIDDADIKKVVIDFWARNVKTNQPINFFESLPKAEVIALKQRLENFKDPTGMTKYFSENKFKNETFKKFESTNITKIAKPKNISL